MNYKNRCHRKNNNLRSIKWQSTFCADMEEKSEDDKKNLIADHNQPKTSDTDTDDMSEDDQKEISNEVKSQAQSLTDIHNLSAGSQKQNLKVAHGAPRTFYNDKETYFEPFQSLSSQKFKGRRFFKRSQSARERGHRGTNRRSRGNFQQSLRQTAIKREISKNMISSSNNHFSYISPNTSTNLHKYNEYEHKYLPDSVNMDQKNSLRLDKESLPKGIDNGENLDSHDIDKVRKWRRAKENFYSLKSCISAPEIIMDYRHQIQRMSDECTVQNLAKIKKISDLMVREKDYATIFKAHYQNLVLQQKQFDKYISCMTNECSLTETDIDAIIKKADNIKMHIENECSLFKRTLPAYAYKGDILDAFKDHQVLLISSDCSYFFNTVIPVIVINELPKYFVLSCESSSMSCAWMKNEIDSVTKHDYIKLKCLNENDMLNYLHEGISSEENCFILNITLKRSVISDLLLSTMHDFLLEHKHSRLILLISMFNDIKKFQKYFSTLKVFSLEVPRLLLPIQTVWKKEPLSITKNYKEDVVCTALSIHLLNDPGDVLAFLPNLADAKIAITLFTKKVKDFNYDNVECILLHENNYDILQLKQQSGSGKRKIIFTTNCAEVMPLQSVRYVIDCGLTRDYIFDSDKNLDVLTIVFNSRAKSRLRKSLVGVYASGICYRIYNKENFCTDMASYELPDILTLNPFNTLIKVFHHQPDKALSVQFVEPLGDALKYNTVKLLKNFNAIKNNKLTQLGKKMVKLPFCARHSKLILQSIQWGFAYEAVILVAFFSIDSFLFKYAKVEDDQQIIDAAKLELFQHESDALTFLHVYKCWMENKCTKVWCDEHYIKYDTLNEVKTKVDEICSIVYDYLSENILQEFSEIEDSASNILELLFHCFSDNLCVYSGHYRCGFRILSSRQAAFLHPSSLLCSKGNMPQFIIFNKIMHTSRNFLFGVTAVTSDLVLNSLTSKTLEYDYSEVFDRSLYCQVIEPVSERIIKQVLLGKKGKKLQEIEDLMKEELKSELIVVDPSVEKGCVSVYALEPLLDSAVKMVNKILKSNLDDVINAEEVHILELKKGETIIPLEVKCMMGAKITSVKIKDISEKSNSVQGSKTVITKPVKSPVSSVQYSVNLTWIRRPCNGICYVNFTPINFMQARKLACRNIFVLESEIYVEVSTREDCQLILTDVPRDAKASDIEACLQENVSGIEIGEIELKLVKPFETSLRDIEEIKMEIQENCEEYTDLLDFDIVVPKPKNMVSIMTAYINVFGSEDLTAAAKNLSNTIIQNFRVNAIPVYRSILKSSFKVYIALETRIMIQIDKLKCDLSKIHPNKDLFRFEAERVNQDVVYIKLLSNDIKIMQLLQKAVHELLEGEILTKNLVGCIHKLFCHGGHMWLRTLEKSKKVYIIEEYNSKTIRVYGSQESCFRVKESILNFLKDTENEAVETVILSHDKNSRILLKSIIKEYGVKLKPLVELCGLRSAVLDIKLCHLFLHGSRDSIDHAKDILNTLSSKLDSTEEYNFLSGGEMCPVCACPAFNLTFRLQHCGHLYCSECILSLIEQSQFPIQCCAKGCAEDIVLDDIVRILNEDEERIKKLLSASLDDFLEKHRSEIFYCPAPDCPMFIYKNDILGRWMCPLCQNEICTNCNVIYHHGFTCDVYQGSKRDPDYSFKVWKTGTSECKDCPRCKTAIEKNEGCDHMTCISCKAHFCWVCVREFPTDTAVYNHIPFCDKYPQW